jgi:hypothetical protein
MPQELQMENSSHCSLYGHNIETHTSIHAATQSNLSLKHLRFNCPGDYLSTRFYKHDDITHQLNKVVKKACRRSHRNLSQRQVNHITEEYKSILTRRCRLSAALSASPSDLGTFWGIRSADVLASALVGALSSICWGNCIVARPAPEVAGLASSEPDDRSIPNHSRLAKWRQRASRQTDVTMHARQLRFAEK